MIIKWFVCMLILRIACKTNKLFISVYVHCNCFNDDCDNISQQKRVKRRRRRRRRRTKYCIKLYRVRFYKWVLSPFITAIKITGKLWGTMRLMQGREAEVACRSTLMYISACVLWHTAGACGCKSSWQWHIWRFHIKHLMHFFPSWFALCWML